MNKPLHASASVYVTGGVNVESFSTVYSLRGSSNVYTITDALRNKNSKDTITLSNYNVSKANLQAQGYKTVAFLFHLSIAEISDGYQEIYITDENNVDYSTGITKLEHGGSNKNTSYSTYEFYAEIPVSLLGAQIIIQYSANGLFNDDWKNTNLEFQFGYSSEYVKLGRLYNVV